MFAELALMGGLGVHWSACQQGGCDDAVMTDVAFAVGPKRHAVFGTSRVALHETTHDVLGR